MNLAKLVLLLTCVCFASASKEMESQMDISKKASLSDLDKNESILSLLLCEPESSAERLRKIDAKSSNFYKALSAVEQKEIAHPNENGVQFRLWQTEMDGNVYVVVVAEDKNLISSYGHEKNAELGISTYREINQLFVDTKKRVSAQKRIYKAISQIWAEISSEKRPTAQLLITGHYLGGGIAQFLGAYSKSEKFLTARPWESKDAEIDDGFLNFLKKSRIYTFASPQVFVAPNSEIDWSSQLGKDSQHFVQEGDSLIVHRNSFSRSTTSFWRLLKWTAPKAIVSGVLVGAAWYVFPEIISRVQFLGKAAETVKKIFPTSRRRLGSYDYEKSFSFQQNETACGSLANSACRKFPEDPVGNSCVAKANEDCHLRFKRCFYDTKDDGSWYSNYNKCWYKEKAEFVQQESERDFPRLAVQEKVPELCEKVAMKAKEQCTKMENESLVKRCVMKAKEHCISIKSSCYHNGKIPEDVTACMETERGKMDQKLKEEYFVDLAKPTIIEKLLQDPRFVTAYKSFFGLAAGLAVFWVFSNVKDAWTAYKSQGAEFYEWGTIYYSPKSINSFYVSKDQKFLTTYSNEMDSKFRNGWFRDGKSTKSLDDVIKVHLLNLLSKSNAIASSTQDDGKGTETESGNTEKSQPDHGTQANNSEGTSYSGFVQYTIFTICIFLSILL